MVDTPGGQMPWWAIPPGTQAPRLDPIGIKRRFVSAADNEEIDVRAPGRPILDVTQDEETVEIAEAEDTR